jgi:hypothetical protein
MEGRRTFLNDTPNKKDGHGRRLAFREGFKWIFIIGFGFVRAVSGW